MQNNKIISVWGSPNSGKTTFSIKLANELAKNKKNVIIVFCDILSPTMQTVIPFTNTENKSLGALLSGVQITQESILEKCILVPKNDYLSVMGYLHGENERTYAKYGKERVIDLFILLRHLADYIIVDCSCYLSYDMLTRTALEMSDKVIRLIGCDLKSISYYDSCLPQLADRKYNLQNHMKVLSNIKPYEPKESVANRYEGVSLELPYCLELEKQYAEGLLFENITHKESNLYQSTIHKIMPLIINEEKENDKYKTNKKVKTDKKKILNTVQGLIRKRGVK